MDTAAYRIIVGFEQKGRSVCAEVSHKYERKGGLFAQRFLSFFGRIEASLRLVVPLSLRVYHRV